MQLLRITQKIYKVYNERGFVQLICAIFLYLKELISFLVIGSGDVLYVSGCPGGSRFYRCINQSEELTNYGIQSKIVSQNRFNLIWLIKKFNIFIFQRVIYNEHIAKVITEIKKQEKSIIFETDDLVFDPKYIRYMHYFNFMSEEEKSWYKNGIGREILEDPYIENCIVSTNYLKEVLKKTYPKKKIFISTNKLSKKQIFWNQATLAKKKKIKLRSDQVRLGYFSGSKSHDKDFEAISDVLLHILKENKNLILMIVGYLNLNETFSEVNNQLEKYPFISLEKLPELILRADINIAPLEIDNPFCQAKSGLKFFEAGILGVPTVASNTDSFSQLIENWENGFLAKNKDDWFKYLTLLIKNKELREKLGARAQFDSLEKHTTQKNYPETEKLVEFIKEQLNVSPL